MFQTVVTHVVSLCVLSCVAYLTCDCIRQVYFVAAAICCFLYVSFLLASFVDYFLPRFRVKSANKAVFITGCDKGFGRLLARRLDSMGFRVFAGCLEPDGKEIQKLKDTVSSRLEFVQIDVTKDESVQSALRIVTNRLGEFQLWALVNNAGVIERGELEWTPIDIYEKQFAVNTFGVVRVTQAFLPLIRKFKSRIVTISSIGGRQTFSGFVPYCMSKHAVTSFCDGLRLEMKKFGVQVITVEPFSYQTGMTETNTALQSIQSTYLKSTSDPATYDEAYVSAFSESVKRFNLATTISDTDRVVDSLVEAVCAISPHYSYVVGDGYSLIYLWFSRKAPKTIVDEFVRRFLTFDCFVERYLEEKAAGKKEK